MFSQTIKYRPFTDTIPKEPRFSQRDPHREAVSLGLVTFYFVKAEVIGDGRDGPGWSSGFIWLFSMVKSTGNPINVSCRFSHQSIEVQMWETKCQTNLVTGIFTIHLWKYWGWFPGGLWPHYQILMGGLCSNPIREWRSHGETHLRSAILESENHMIREYHMCHRQITWV